jgi:hypothetical protein
MDKTTDKITATVLEEQAAKDYCMPINTMAVEGVVVVECKVVQVVQVEGGVAVLRMLLPVLERQERVVGVAEMV